MKKRGTRQRVKCPVCGEIDAKLFLKARSSTRRGDSCYGTRKLGVPNPHGAIYVCPACHWGITHPLPSEEELAWRYERMQEDSYLDEATTRSVSFQRELDTLLSLLTEPPTVLLDVGCSYGLLLRIAENRGLHPVGLEPSSDAVATCRKTGLEVRQGGLELLEPGETFDIVFMWDVLEHLRDPAQAIERIRKHMRPGGVVSIVVPDRQSLVARLLGERWWSILDLHLHYPTRKSFHSLLEQKGFVVLHSTTHAKLISAPMLAQWIPVARLRRAMEKMLPPSFHLSVDPRDQILVRAQAA